MSKILVADDETSIREGLVALLESEFHEVHSASNGEDALYRYWEIKPDVLILDVMMPRKDGVCVCRSVRMRDSVTPIIMLSARSNETDKVLALGVGADDYLCKPFSSAELIARVNALLRRVGVVRVDETAQSVDFRLGSGLVHGNQLLFITSRGEAVPLTPHECNLMRILAAHPYEVVSKDRLLDLVWGIDYTANSRVLEQHVYNLRKKMSGNGFTIQTVRNSGVRYVPEDAAMVTYTSYACVRRTLSNDEAPHGSLA